MPDEIDWTVNEWAGEKIFDYDDESLMRIRLTFKLMDQILAKGWTIAPGELSDEDVFIAYECPHCKAVEDYLAPDDTAVWDEMVCDLCDEWFTVHLHKGEVRYIEPGQTGELPYEH